VSNQCYLVECSNLSSLQKEVSSLVSKHQFHEEEITYYDLEESTLDQVLEDLDTYSFLTPRKVIVISHTLFLTSSELKFLDEHLQHLLKYLKNPNPDVLFVMGVEKCDERKKIVKDIKKLVEVIKVEESPLKIARDALKDYKISEEALRYLVEFCGNDIMKLTNECEKLKMYAMEEKEIQRTDIDTVVIKNIPNTEQLAFDFVKYIASRDKSRIFACYEQLKEYRFEPHSMIGLLESQIKLIYQVYLGKQKQMTKDEIAKYLKEHPFRVQKTLEFLPLYREEELQELIHKLHDLDYRIKSGQVDATLGFEVFLLSI